VLVELPSPRHQPRRHGVGFFSWIDLAHAIRAS
jgi:hypothetical protein